MTVAFACITYYWLVLVTRCDKIRMKCIDFVFLTFISLLNTLHVYPFSSLLTYFWCCLVLPLQPYVKWDDRRHGVISCLHTAHFACVWIINGFKIVPSVLDSLLISLNLITCSKFNQPEKKKCLSYFSAFESNKSYDSRI